MRFKYYSNDILALPPEMLCEIASYRSIELIKYLRQEIFEARIKSSMRCGALTLGVGIGMTFYPLVTTILCGTLGLMFIAHETAIEKTAVKFAAVVCHALLSYKIGGMPAIVTNTLPTILVGEVIRLINGIVNQSLELMTTAAISAITTSISNCFVYNYNFYSSLASSSSFSLVLFTGAGLALTSAFYEDGIKPSLDYIINASKYEVEILADASYKSYVYIKESAVNGLNRFIDKVSKNLSSLQPEIGEGITR